MKEQGIEPSELEIQGAFDSQKSRWLHLKFEKCDRSEFENTCESDEVISEWLKYKYLVVLEN